MDEIVVLDHEIPDFIRTTAIDKLGALTKRIRGVPGGTSAGKTYGIVPILIDYAVKHERKEISVVSESIPHLRKGAAKDFIKIMKATGRWRESRWNKTIMKYEFSNGSYIEFFSVDQPDKLRGARRHVLYINECNNVKWSAYMQLAVRTADIIWLDFNPTHEFWYHTEIAQKRDPDWEELVLTYKDNEGAPKAAVREIEKARIKAYHNPRLEPPALFDEKNIKDSWWANWYRVYGLGFVGRLEGVVFSNYDVIDDIPKEAIYVGQGLDFGYTNDPSAITDIYSWINKKGEEYRILDEVLYSTGMLNAEMVPYLRSPVIADSAEPKSIDELWTYGIDIRGATKGADSILFGIQTMQKQNYLVTKRSFNILKELRNYTWDLDKDGNSINKPIDKWNHAIDGIRYHEMETLGIDDGYWVF